VGKDWLAVDKLALSALIVLCAIGAYGVATLPPTIPTHFSVDGVASGYGSKLLLLVLPVVGLGLAGLVEATIKANVTPNLPFTIPDEALERIAPLSAAMQRALRAVLLGGFALLEWAILESAEAGSLAPGFAWALSATIVATFATIGAYGVRIWRVARG